MSTNLIYGAIAAIVIGIFLYFKSSKERQENGEWSSGLQWAYLLCMIGVFGILSFYMSFTAVLLIFVVFTGIVWAIHKGRLKKDPSHQDKAHFTDYMSGFFPIILVVFILRTFIAEPFQIPSSSMRPGLVKGDFILVNKFAYGIRTPIINNVLIPTGQIERGDVVVFNYPVQPEMNYIKRIVGLPGDTVEYRDKVLTVNGQVAPDQPNGTYSYPDDTEPSAIHSPELFQTTLNGKSFNILKEPGQPTISIPALDKYRMEIMPENGYSVEQSGLKHCQYAEDGSGFTCKVPEGRYFAMGDNRDNSADSRYWGFVDDKLIVGKAFFVWMNFGDYSRIGSSIH
ncbi:signal peptidase I [Neisseria mucosa]|uniref:signal peptidase I n=1 Tax=Neisseria mucosa TaxID=488 RepID=UPI000D16FDE4|nr:signal peptidase I [Neisseria mucosa]